MERKALFFRLKPGTKEEYVQRHKDIWPEMRELLSLAGFRNYSIWNYGDMLFACYEMEDPSKAEEILKNSEVYARWRRDMEKYVYIEPVTNQKEWPMTEVFYHN
jgi:L-rhamnose mutarotase